MSIKNSNDIIGNRTRDLPACSAVPQLNAPPCAPDLNTDNYEFKTMLEATADFTFLANILLTLLYRLQVTHDNARSKFIHTHIQF